MHYWPLPLLPTPLRREGRWAVEVTILLLLLLQPPPLPCCIVVVVA
jgi:hypothetical protein